MESEIKDDASLDLKNKEDDLLQRWRKSFSADDEKLFVSDGAADAQAYLMNTPRILLLLKEVNDQGGGGWDLRDLLRTSDRRPTWDNVARWIYAIRSLPRDVPWQDLCRITKEQRRKMLLSIAAINLKKIPGGHTANNQAIQLAANRDVDYLREQFSLYKADLVICCGVSGEAFRPKDRSRRQTSHGVEYFEHLPGKFVVEYAHPEARVADNILHYGLIDAIRELLTQKAD